MKSSKNKYRNYVIYTLRSNAGTYRSYSLEWKWEPRYFNRQELINHLARYHGGNKDILSNLTDNMDKKVGERILINYYWMDTPTYFMAKIVNSEFVKVDTNSLVDSVEKRAAELDEKKKHRSAVRAFNRKVDNCYEFRKEPVPNVHNHKRWHRGTWYRHPATYQSKRNAFDYELEEFMGDGWNRKAKNLPTAYDDICRHKDRCWKTSYKVKKQWEKHCKKHVDTIVIPVEAVEELAYEES